MLPALRRSVQMKDWQILSWQKGPVAIRCISGAVWVTWPKCKETVLQTGQWVRIAATGKVCVQALTGSEVAFQ